MTDIRLRQIQQLIQSGDPAQARRLLDPILAAEPDNLHALHLAGIAAMSVGDFRRAVELLQRAVSVDDTRAVLFSNLGSAQQAAGDVDGALVNLKRAVELDGHNPVNHYNLGVALAERNAPADAEQAFRGCLARDRHHVPALYNLASLLQDRGAVREAEDLYRQVVTLAPQTGEAHHNLAMLLAQRGAPDEAVAHYERAAQLGIGLSAVFLGDLHQLRNGLDQAAASYRRALSLDANSADAHGKLGLLLVDMGNTDSGLRHIVRALEIAPERPELWQTFARAAARLPSSDAPEYVRLVQNALERDEVESMYLAAAAAGILARRHDLAATARSLAVIDFPVADTSLQRRWASLCDDPLLPVVLRNAIVTDEQLERVLAALRRLALISTVSADGAGRPFFAERLGLLTALATQCFTNEFVWDASAAEIDLVTRMGERLVNDPAETIAADPVSLCIAGCYLPLSTLDRCERLLQPTWPAAVQDWLNRTLANDLHERRLRERIPRLTPVEDDTSKRVRAQYEQSPYPRWFRVERQPASTTGRTLQATFPGIVLNLGEPPNVLVAGCGTGRHAAEVGWQYADADILAVDLSLASLAYARRMVEQYGFTNITFAQADLLTLDVLPQGFDVIECSGVLHHLREPIAGWRVLRKLLAPRGLMRIGLYSRLARAPVRAARQLIEQRALPPTAEGIRAGRAAIRDLGPDHPAHAVSQWYDFYSLSTCRDLLYHVQETDFDLDELRAMLDALHLEFLGFTLLRGDSRVAYQRRYPDDPGLKNLVRWYEFERDHPDLFSGMYQFWCRARD